MSVRSMMREWGWSTPVIMAVLCFAGLRASAQEGPVTSPDVRILAPVADAYISGSTRLLAYVNPSTLAESVTFLVDGRQACQLSAPPFECAWDAGSAVTARQIRVVVQLASGGRVVRTVRTKGLDFAENVDVEAVQVTVTVMDDSARNFVPGLPRTAFRIFEDDEPQTISVFASENIPTEMVVAIDISSSMTATMQKLKESVKRFLAAIPLRDKVTLLGFNDTVFALTRRAVDLEERARAVDRLAPWGATALYDVIVQGVDILGRRPGRKALVVFSDGEDQGSHVTLDEVERRLQSSDVTLYMIGQGRGLERDYLQLVMDRLSVPTGGRTFLTDNVDALQGAFELLLDELSKQYLLGYQPTDATRDDRWREIRVEVEGHRNIRARQGYRAVPVQ